MGQPRNILCNKFQNPWVNPSLCRWEWTWGKEEEWGKGNKRGPIKILHQITDKMQKEHGLKSTSPLLTHPPAPSRKARAKGRTQPEAYLGSM